MRTSAVLRQALRVVTHAGTACVALCRCANAVRATFTPGMDRRWHHIGTAFCIGSAECEATQVQVGRCGGAAAANLLRTGPQRL